LSTALGVDSPSDPAVVEATGQIAAAARAAGKTLCAHVGRLDSPEVAWLTSLGVSTFILSSDQGLMRAAAVQALAEFKPLRG
jgi:2-keto-3-deoxy-L-rhamnonate aldolase RhmA